MEPNEGETLSLLRYLLRAVKHGWDEDIDYIAGEVERIYGPDPDDATEG